MNDSSIGDDKSLSSLLSNEMDIIRIKEMEYSDRFQKLFAYYDDIKEYLTLDKQLVGQLEHQRLWIDRLKSVEFSVAFIGNYSVGKSTLINAIIGNPVLPEDTKACTAVPTILKKGKENIATIFYLNMKQRHELKKQYIELLFHHLYQNNVDKEKLLNLSEEKLIEQMQGYIDKHKISEKEADIISIWTNLKKLLLSWNKNTHDPENILLEDLNKKITDENENIIIIDRAEIYIKDLNIPNSIVFTDLPGLGVVNPRHQIYTRDFARNKAKALILCSRGDNLLEGDEIRLLSEIQSTRPSVLKRAFWVLNKWDLITSQREKEDIEKDIEGKLLQYKINIPSNRRYKVSARNYLLLSLEQNNMSDHDYFMDHKENIDKKIFKKKIGFESPEIQKFSEFRKDLFTYLNTTARKEYLEEVNQEFLYTCKEIRKHSLPLFQEYSDFENRADQALFKKFSKELEEVLDNLNSTIIDHIKNIRIALMPDFQLLNSENFIKILDEKISGAMNDISSVNNIFNEYVKGLDKQKNTVRLHSIIEKYFPINSYVRDLIRKNIYETIVSKNNSVLYADIHDSLVFSEDVNNDIKLLLDHEILLSRIEGICDVVLSQYESEINTTILNGINFLINKKTDQSKVHNDSERIASGTKSEIQKILTNFPLKVFTFIESKQEDLNNHIRIGIKNYYEILEIQLLDLINTKKERISKDLFIKLSSKIKNIEEVEKQKQKIILQSHNGIKELMIHDNISKN